MVYLTLILVILKQIKKSHFQVNIIENLFYKELV